MNSYTSGSGIYSSGTPLESFFNPTMDSEEKLLLHSLPKIPPTNSSERIAPIISSGHEFLLQQGVSDWEYTTFLATAGASGSTTISLGNLTCTASYQIRYVSHLIRILSPNLAVDKTAILLYS